MSFWTSSSIFGLRCRDPEGRPRCKRGRSQEGNNKIASQLGHASGNQQKRSLADQDGGNFHLVDNADEVLEQCEVCRAFDKAPHVLAVGTSTASMSDEKAQVDLMFSGNLIDPHAMDMYPKYALPLPVRSEILRRSGMSFPEVGRAFLARPRASTWTKEVNGSMRFGRICARNVVSNCNFEGRAPTHGFLNGAMASPEEFIADSLMIGSPAGRSSPRCNGA